MLKKLNAIMHIFTFQFLGKEEGHSLNVQFIFSLNLQLYS
jgi:hypothetical protein